jgi:hypothetical protein
MRFRIPAYWDHRALWAAFLRCWSFTGSLHCFSCGSESISNHDGRLRLLSRGQSMASIASIEYCG